MQCQISNIFLIPSSFSILPSWGISQNRPHCSASNFLVGCCQDMKELRTHWLLDTVNNFLVCEFFHRINMTSSWFLCWWMRLHSSYDHHQYLTNNFWCSRLSMKIAKQFAEWASCLCWHWKWPWDKRRSYILCRFRYNSLQEAISALVWYVFYQHHSCLLISEPLLVVPSKVKRELWKYCCPIAVRHPLKCHFSQSSKPPLFKGLNLVNYLNLAFAITGKNGKARSEALQMGLISSLSTVSTHSFAPSSSAPPWLGFHWRIDWFLGQATLSALEAAKMSLESTPIQRHLTSCVYTHSNRCLIKILSLVYLLYHTTTHKYHDPSLKVLDQINKPGIKVSYLREASNFLLWWYLVIVYASKLSQNAFKHFPVPTDDLKLPMDPSFDVTEVPRHHTIIGRPRQLQRTPPLSWSLL